MVGLILVFRTSKLALLLTRNSHLETHHFSQLILPDKYRPTIISHIIIILCPFHVLCKLCLDDCTIFGTESILIIFDGLGLHIL